MNDELFRKFFYPNAEKLEKESDSDEDEEAGTSNLPSKLSAAQSKLLSRPLQSLTNTKYGMATTVDDKVSLTTNQNGANKHLLMMKSLQDMENNLR